MNIQELCDRYSLKNRQSIYEWAKALDIKFDKNNSNKSYATSEQIELFDQLSEHLKNGNTLKSFSPLVKTTVSFPSDTVNLSADSVGYSVNQLPDTVTFIHLVTAIASLKSPISHHEELEKACINNWLLSTSEIKQLGFSVSCKNGKTYCDRGCWRFIKVGKVGHESSWKVSKLLREYSP